MGACEVCRASADSLVRWDRIAPPTGSIRICADCSRDFVFYSQDRSSDSDNLYRILGLTHHLGGEVWRVGDRAYWYRDPLYPARTAMLDPPPGPAASPYTSYLYRLAGVRFRRTSASRRASPKPAPVVA